MSEEDNRSHVLLSHRLARWKLLLLYFATVVAAATPVCVFIAMLAWDAELLFTLYGGLAVGVVLFAALWLIGRMMQSAVRISCDNAGLRLTMLSGRRASIQWSDLRYISRVVGCVIIGAHDQRYFLVLVPRPISEALVILAREASDARIVGF